VGDIKRNSGAAIDVAYSVADLASNAGADHESIAAKNDAGSEFGQFGGELR
jgi:hypothetical protein